MMMMMHLQDVNPLCSEGGRVDVNSIKHSDLMTPVSNLTWSGHTGDCHWGRRCKSGGQMWEPARPPSSPTGACWWGGRQPSPLLWTLYNLMDTHVHAPADPRPEELLDTYMKQRHTGACVHARACLCAGCVSSARGLEVWWQGLTPRG